jgi:hypothetical protein
MVELLRNASTSDVLMGFAELIIGPAVGRISLALPIPQAAVCAKLI